jgi:O-antigen ligase
LPDSYTKRMSTIEDHQADTSASTRVAVWKWTYEYALDHPFGGGFDAFLGNSVRYVTQKSQTDGSTTEVQSTVVEDKGRAYHSAYFEVLGEQGWPGLIVWLLLQATGIFQLEGLRRRLESRTHEADLSDFALATALQNGHLIYLLGALFVGIAYQPFVYMLIGLQIALTTQVRLRLAGTGRPDMLAARPNRAAARPTRAAGTQGTVR